MIESAGIQSLITSLRRTESAESLFPLAATASALMNNTDRPGSLLVVHLTILTIAGRIDGEAIMQDDWGAIKMLLSHLADLLEFQVPEQLDSLGVAWRAWAQPNLLQ